MRKLILILLPLLNGCSGGFGTMDGIMESWYGSSFNEVTAQWGYPSREETIGNHTMYYWSYSKSVAIPATTTGTVTNIGSTSYINTSTYGGGVVTGNCTRMLVFDKNNIVIGAHWTGNNCPFAEVMEYSNWRRNEQSDAVRLYDNNLKMAQDNCDRKLHTFHTKGKYSEFNKCVTDVLSKHK
jgi:hypothetical protein